MSKSRLGRPVRDCRTAGWQSLPFLLGLYAVLLRALVPAGSMPAIGDHGLEFVLCTGGATTPAHAAPDPWPAPHDAPARHAPCAFLGFGPALSGDAAVPAVGNTGPFGIMGPIRADLAQIPAIPHERPFAIGPPSSRA